MNIEIQYDDHIYEVEFDYSLGKAGTYFDPPEPHDVEILEVYDENGKLITNAEILEYIDQETYEYVDNNLY